MRIIQTFVLRLLLDAECPGELRGSLYCIADNSEYAFADAEALLAQLRQVASLREPKSEEGSAADKPEEP